MKITKIFIALLFILFGFSGCEKDDICDPNTPTTPQIVIEFLSKTTNALSVPNKLKIEDSQTSKELPVGANTKIKLPLKTDVNETIYTLTLNSDVATAKNSDKLILNYSRNSVFISRACGYKTNFVFNVDQSIVMPEVSPNTKWIDRIVITKPNILNEDETHIKIYF